MNGEWPPIREAHRIESLAVLGQGLIIVVGAVSFDDGDHGVLRHEPGQVVDVPVSIVAHDAVAQPDDLADAEVVAQPGLDVVSCQCRVAVRVQQTLFGCHQCAGAVDLDRAAFQHHVDRFAGDAERFRHLRRDRVVEIEWRILAAPGVEPEIQREALRALRPVTRDEYRSVIAAPGIVGREPMKPDVGRVGPAFQQVAHVSLVGGVQYVDTHEFVGRQRGDEASHDRFHGLELTGPALALVRPGYPGRLVR